LRYTEILEACWKGYRQVGMKKKGDRQVPNCVPVSEQQMEEDLKKWFKEKWVRFGPDGKIRGDCARGSSSEGKPKCLPQAKAQALGKKGRAASAAKKRREDPNPERRGTARNVATRVNEFAPGADGDNEPDFHPETFYDIPKLKKVYKQLASRSVNSGWYGYQLTRLIGAMEDLYTINADVLDDMFPTAPEIANYIERNIIKAFPSENPPYVINNPDYKPRAPRSPNPGMAESQLDEKQDACYRKVKSRYKVWPSAYASGALVQCRKKGAANWGNKDKK
jgi:hypothetical protein